MNLCVIFSAGNPTIPDYRDEILFLHFKSELLNRIEKGDIDFFGYAPDNTADGNDELLRDGTFFRIIASETILKLTLESQKNEIISAFKILIEKEKKCWGTIIIEKGFITTETTIEFIF